MEKSVKKGQILCIWTVAHMLVGITFLEWIFTNIACYTHGGLTSWCPEKQVPFSDRKEKEKTSTSENIPVSEIRR